MKTRLLAALVVLGLAAAWAPSAEAQVNPLAARVTADRLTTSTTFVDVPDLTWYIAASTNYAFVCELSYLTVGPSTLQLSVNGPTIGTGAVRFSVTTATSATAVHFASQNAYDANTTPGAGLTTALPATIAGVIENGATAGPVAIRFRRLAGTSVTILRGSSCTVYR